MKPISIAQIRKVTGATEISPDTDDGPIAAISTDTRRIDQQCLFIALRGENFDAHDFLNQAAAAGATAAIVDTEPKSPPRNLRLLRVKSTRAAMAVLARHLRQQMRGKVIAVAGSNGKTGAKYLIHSLLGKKLRGSISPKSFNNDVGVPLAIFPADPTQDYLVLELGTNHPGEIRTLTNIALPDIAVITNCSQEHLEFLGDVAGVRRENASLIEGLHHDGTLIVNGDDPELLDAVAAFPGKRVTFGFSPSNDLSATNIRCGLDGTHFTIQPGNISAFVPLLGRHSAANALAAFAVARAMDLTDAQIVENLRSASAPEMRLQLLKAGGLSILNDAYNANPASMSAAIQTLALLPTTGRRIAILGDMRELGASSAECHRQIGHLIATRFPPDLLICVGPESRAIAAEAIDQGMPAHRVEHFPDAVSTQAISSRLADGDLILLKASRAIGLESVAKAIIAARPSTGNSAS